MLADSSANWTVLPQYDPFGQSQPTSLTKFGYTGEQKDASGLEFLRARYYDQNLGIFTSKDPAAGSTSDPITMNGYAYGSQNPINRNDPSGRCDGSLLGNSRLYLESCANDLEKGRQDWNKGGIVNFDQGVLDGTGLQGTVDSVGGHYNDISNSAGSFYSNPNLQTYSNFGKTTILAELSLVGDLSMLIPPVDGGGATEEEVIKAIEPCDVALSKLSEQELVDAVSQLTRNHNVNVAELVSKFPELLGKTDAEMGEIIRGALLHDTGKFETPLRILEYPGKLSDADFIEMKKHAAQGAEIIMNELGLEENSIIVRIAKEHHLTGLTDPVVSVVNFFDQMEALGSYNRSYKIHFSVDESLKMVIGNAEKNNQPVVKALAEGFQNGIYDYDRLSKILDAQQTRDIIKYFYTPIGN